MALLLDLPSRRVRILAQVFLTVRLGLGAADCTVSIVQIKHKAPMGCNKKKKKENDN